MRHWILAICGVVALQGCASPRLITHITGSGAQMKLVYEQHKWMGGGEVGLIQCDQLPDGTLTNCKKMPIIFETKNGGAK